jgi:hypothetical protein
LNPIKKIYNVGKSIASLGFKYEKGIWIGTRPLAKGNVMIGTSISPGADICHYALMCDGIIYHLNDMDE